MKNNFLSPDGFQNWLKKEQQDACNENIVGKKVYSKLKFSNLLESIEIIEGNEFEIAKCFRKHGAKVIESTPQGILTLETKKGKFSIEETNIKKHQS